MPQGSVHVPVPPGATQKLPRQQRIAEMPVIAGLLKKALEIQEDEKEAAAADAATAETEEDGRADRNMGR
ncbi:hypothetical protein NDU88_003938 [Pleurodeles waltl]|uniref:Uncharacterized protein n=1 Tax=Pleurodeles waltl TaxID=8319 RepID=A0AAV7WQV0_PLEWA|nr:hypothetical protein NDU88_003938 [Pleurodeles waltl]